MARRDRGPRQGYAAHVAAGAAAEQDACAWLRRRGLQVLQRNYRVRGGEIDIIALDGAALVFVEVRLRSSSACGGACASVDARKRARIVHAARHYLARHAPCALNGAVPCRFDVIAFEPAGPRWVRAAFDAE